MNVLIKCYTDNMRGNVVVFQIRRHPPDTPDPEQGDRIFLWKLEIENPRPDNTHSSGGGLAARGVLAQKPNHERQNARPHLRISISSDADFPRQPFNNEVLREILKENSQSTQLEFDLATRLKTHAHEGITRLSDEEAEYLDKLYDHVAIDLGNIRRDPLVVDETTRQRLVEARLGQGRFRRQVLEKWQRRCVVSGCTLEDILRASHIKPWRDSNTDEQLDPANGLLLTANLDALFGRYLISFEDDGRMLVSRTISPTECEMLGIPRTLRSDISLGRQECNFLCQHRRVHRARMATPRER